MYTYLSIALGGALGSMARYATGVYVGRWLGTAFPWGTLLINIVGSFLIGVFRRILRAALGCEPIDARLSRRRYLRRLYDLLDLLARYRDADQSRRSARRWRLYRGLGRAGSARALCRASRDAADLRLIAGVRARDAAPPSTSFTDRRPATRRILAEKLRRRIPRAVAALFQPAPIGRVGVEDPAPACRARRRDARPMYRR